MAKIPHTLVACIAIWWLWLSVAPGCRPAPCRHIAAPRALRAAQGSKRPRATQGPKGHAVPVELDPARIDATHDRVLVPRDLFERGLAALRKKHFEKAASIFASIPRLFPGWAGRWSALFNEAVAREGARQYPTAAKRYHQVALHSPDPAERLDAAIRRAVCLGRSGRKRIALSLLKRILADSNTDDAHFMDAACAQARILIAEKRFDEADRVLERALQLARLSATPQRLAPKAARCAYWYGRSAEERMKAVALTLPVRRLEASLLEKSNLFTKARKRYIKVLDHRHPGWAALALERLAAMFESYFWAVVKAPLPPFGPVLYYDGKRRAWRTLSPRLVMDRYRRRLKRNLGSAMRLAIRIYRKQLADLATAGWSEAILEPAKRRMDRFARLVQRLPNMPVGPEKEQTPEARKGPRSGKHPMPLPCPFHPWTTGLPPASRHRPAGAG